LVVRDTYPPTRHLKQNRPGQKSRRKKWSRAPPPTRETAKLYLVWKALQLRARRADAFASGSYEPVDAGPGICAFVRGGAVLVAVPIAPGASYTAPGGFVDVLDADLGIWLLEAAA
jgi:maltooligosyltrehalose synthase